MFKLYINVILKLSIMSAFVIVFRSSSLDSKIAACVAEYSALQDKYEKVEMVDADTLSYNYLYSYLLNCVRTDGVDVCVIGEGLKLTENVNNYAVYGNLIWFDNAIDDDDIDFVIAGIRDKRLYNYMLVETYFFGDNGVLPYRIMKNINKNTPIKVIRNTVAEFFADWNKRMSTINSDAE